MMNTVLVQPPVATCIVQIRITFAIIVISVASIFTFGFTTTTKKFIYFGIHRHNNRCHSHYFSSTRNDESNDAVLNGSDDFINILEGPFTSTIIQDNWGKRPILVRNAFPLKLHKHVWPCWNDIINLSCDDHTSTKSLTSDNDDNGHTNYSYQMESGESARFVQHVPGKLDSFTLDVGPFDSKELQRQMSTTATINNNKSRKKQQKVWTLLLNDVERYFPSLDTWMNEHFHFIPRWRRDDAQISCTSTIHGGIGPHVDNYDVCLIQISGRRLWRILSVSPKEGTMSHILEQQLLIPNIPVSVLNLSSTISSTSDNNKTNATIISELEQSQWIELLLDEGDMLYLPPRFVHWGLGQSTDCMTLSVGARAPSASDILIRITEHVQQHRQPLSSLARYKDDVSNLAFLRDDRISNGCNQYSESRRTSTELETQYKQPTLSKTVKQSMKKLVQNMMDDLMNDDLMWDMIVGKLITDPLRYSDTFPIPFSENQHIPDYQEVWETLTPIDVIKTVEQLGHQGSLRKVAGISSATSQIITPNALPCNYINTQSANTNDTVIDRLYVNGEMYETFTIKTNDNCANNPTIASIIFHRIDDSLPIYGTMLQGVNTTSPMLVQILQDLIENGIIRPAHVINHRIKKG